MAKAGTRKQKKGPYNETSKVRNRRSSDNVTHVNFNLNDAVMTAFEMNKSTENSWPMTKLYLEERDIRKQSSKLSMHLSELERVLERDDITEAELERGLLELQKIERLMELNREEHDKFRQRMKIAKDAETLIRNFFNPRQGVIGFSKPIVQMLDNKDLAELTESPSLDYLMRVSTINSGGGIMRGVVYSENGNGFLQTFELKLIQPRTRTEDGPLLGDDNLMLNLAKYAAKYQALKPKEKQSTVSYVRGRRSSRAMSNFRKDLEMGWNVYKKIDEEPFHSLWAVNGKKPTLVMQFGEQRSRYLFSPNKRTPFSVLPVRTIDIISEELLNELFESADLSEGDFFADSGIVYKEGEHNEVITALFSLAQSGKLYPNQARSLEKMQRTPGAGRKKETGNER